MKKHIIIFTCEGGGGHIAAAEAITGYLRNEYNVTTINIFKEILLPLDAIRFLSFGYYNNEILYNFCARKNWAGVINFLYPISNLFMFFTRAKATELTRAYLEQEKPDLVISVVPLFNRAIHDATAQQSIPFIIVPTDLNSAHFVNGFPTTYQKNFHYCLPFDDTHIKTYIESAQIEEKNYSITGFPVKSEFLKSYDNSQLKYELELPHSKPLIMVLMGAQGSKATLTYVQALSKLSTPHHIIVCLGKNEKLRALIESIKLPPHITMSVFGFTNKVAQLMKVSDVLISKPGSVSVCEALYSSTPLLLDNTAPRFLWERYNLEFIKKHRLGDVINNFDELPQLLRRYVGDKKYRTTIQSNVTGLEKKELSATLKPIITAFLS